MADTNFVNTVTLTEAEWFNDVNRLHYTILGDPADVAAARTALGIVATSIATQADQEAPASLTTIVTPGRQHFHPSAVKAHGNWDDSGTLLGITFNISSITDSATGDHTINFGTALSTGNHALTFMCGENSTGNTIVSIGRAAGASHIQTRTASGTVVDPGLWMVAVFGDFA
jgi:hypothetical protein